MTAQVFLENNRKKGSGILDDRFISKTTDLGQHCSALGIRQVKPKILTKQPVLKKGY